MNIQSRQNRWLVMAIVLAILLLLAVFVWHGIKSGPKKPALNVLFIGNSYTSANNLPDLFAQAAASAGFARPTVKSFAPGGQTWSGQLADPKVKDLIVSGPAGGRHWDAVILQEQSETPAAAQSDPNLNKTFLDSAAGLGKLVRDFNPNARIILYETWARGRDWYKSGSPNFARDGFSPADMTKKLKTGYEAAAQAIAAATGQGAEIARVGEIWQADYNTASPVELYDSDNSHPNFAGSYAAALDIFSTVYQISPLKVKYQGSLPQNQAAALRSLVDRNFPDIAQ